MRTFIRAFESSPVHCLKPRPCLNRRSPGKSGARANLDIRLVNRVQSIKNDIPTIDIRHNTSCARFPVNKDQIIFNPLNQVVFETTFYNLVEEIWCDELVDVGTWKRVSEWLESERNEIIVCDFIEINVQLHPPQCHIHPIRFQARFC